MANALGVSGTVAHVPNIKKAAATIGGLARKGIHGGCRERLVRLGGVRAVHHNTEKLSGVHVPAPFGDPTLYRDAVMGFLAGIQCVEQGVKYLSRVTDRRPVVVMEELIGDFMRDELTEFSAMDWVACEASCQALSGLPQNLSLLGRLGWWLRDNFLGVSGRRFGTDNHEFQQNLSRGRVMVNPRLAVKLLEGDGASALTIMGLRLQRGIVLRLSGEYESTGLTRYDGKGDYRHEDGWGMEGFMYRLTSFSLERRARNSVWFSVSNEHVVKPIDTELCYPGDNPKEKPLTLRYAGYREVKAVILTTAERPRILPSAS